MGIISLEVCEDKITSNFTYDIKLIVKNTVEINMRLKNFLVDAKSKLFLFLKYYEKV